MIVSSKVKQSGQMVAGTMRLFRSRKEYLGMMMLEYEQYLEDTFKERDRLDYYFSEVADWYDSLNVRCWTVDMEDRFPSSCWSKMAIKGLLTKMAPEKKTFEKDWEASVA